MNEKREMKKSCCLGVLAIALMFWCLLLSIQGKKGVRQRGVTEANLATAIFACL
jgi:hypothetical protein